MIKIIIFIVLTLLIITAFPMSLNFFTTGISELNVILNEFSPILNFIKEEIQLIFSSNILSTFILIGIVFIVITALLKMITNKND